MKFRKSLLLLISFVIAYHAHGQLSFGVTGGLNINSIALEGKTDPYDFKPEANIGYHVGIQGILTLSEKVSFVPSIQFSKRGYNDSGNRVNLNYLEVPFLVSFSTFKRLSVELGPQVGFNLSTYIRSESGRSRNLPDLYNNFDFGLTGGLKSDVSEKLSIYARYYLGLSAIDKIYLRDNNNVTTVIKEYNRGVHLGLGYRLK